MRKIINKRELSNTFQVSLSSASANYSVLRLPASRKDNLRNRPCHGKKYALLRFSMQQPATIIYIYIYLQNRLFLANPPTPSKFSRTARVNRFIAIRQIWHCFQLLERENQYKHRLPALRISLYTPIHILHLFSELSAPQFIAIKIVSPATRHASAAPKD